MGYQVSDNSTDQEHSNQTAYVGNGVFEPLLRQLASQYGTQQAAADQIFGGKQYAKARTFLDEKYRDLTPSQGQSLNNARAIQQQNETMPSYKGSDGTVWAWDKEAQIYVGWVQGKGQDGKPIGAYVNKVGAWSPWDKDNPIPPWKQTTPNDVGGGQGTDLTDSDGDGIPDSQDPNSGAGTTTGSTGGTTGSTGGSTTTGTVGGGGSITTTTGGGSGPRNDAPSVNPGTNPQTGRPWGVSRRVPGVGRSDEQGLTGLGVRTESPSTGSATLESPGVKPPLSGTVDGEGPSFQSRIQGTARVPWDEGRQYPGRGPDYLPTGASAQFTGRTGPSGMVDSTAPRENWQTSYDPRPSDRTLGKQSEEDTFAKLLAGLRGR